jgi:hypothetical protein
VQNDRDDRVLKATHILGAVIVPFLVVAFALLYVFPGDTRSYFAWDVQPRITPMIMGAGYIAGAYFFARVVFEQRFHRIHIGFLPVTAFTIFMAIGSFAHLDRFLQDNVAFWIWIGLYVTTPILVPLAWLANRRTDPGTPEPGESRLSPAIRATLIGAGAFQSIVALALLLSPQTMIDVWPWMLTPLTAQTLGGWFALPGITAVMMGLDGRPSAIRITLHSQVIGLTLILVALARAWDDIDSSNALSYVLVAGLVALLAGLLALWAHMRRLDASGRKNPSPADLMRKNQSVDHNIPV